MQERTFESVSQTQLRFLNPSSMRTSYRFVSTATSPELTGEPGGSNRTGSWGVGLYLLTGEGRYGESYELSV